MSLVRISRRLCREVDALEFESPVTHVYNPLRYARDAHEIFLKRFGGKPKEALFLGMNPGPWGMGQTGVPFGDPAMVRDWMGIECPVDIPAGEHPKRPVRGFDSPRAEVSGSRLWGWAQDRFNTPEAFFERFFVVNYCPLAFLEETGRNRTPDKLPASERAPLLEACDRALAATVRHLEPEIVIGVGVWARKCAQRVLADSGVSIEVMLHPSPASPKANRGWASQAEADLIAAGIRL